MTHNPWKQAIKLSHTLWPESLGRRSSSLWPASLGRKPSCNPTLCPIIPYDPQALGDDHHAILLHAPTSLESRRCCDLSIFAQIILWLEYGGFCPFVFYNTWLKRVETEKYDTMLIKGVRKLEKQDSGDVWQPPEFQGGGGEEEVQDGVQRGRIIER